VESQIGLSAEPSSCASIESSDATDRSCEESTRGPKKFPRRLLAPQVAEITTDLWQKLPEPSDKGVIL